MAALSSLAWYWCCFAGWLWLRWRKYLTLRITISTALAVGLIFCGHQAAIAPRPQQGTNYRRWTLLGLLKANR